VREKLPVHGFVLAGGKSSRMGTDKALLQFRGQPLVEIAVEKLREFCAEVSIAGNRNDLSRFAPVVCEERVDCGPAAGIEAGLQAAQQEWAMFVPVDVPLIPVELLRAWAEDGLRRASGRYFGGSFLRAGYVDQPSFCFLPRDSRMLLSMLLEGGERSLNAILGKLEPKGEKKWVLPLEAELLAGVMKPSALQMEYWFSNLNTPNEFDVAEAWAEADSLRE
jgi:molybdopterin-guanine dinucleotide biosynthesis protein A